MIGQEYLTLADHLFYKRTFFLKKILSYQYVQLLTENILYYYGAIKSSIQSFSFLYRVLNFLYRDLVI